MRPLLDQRQHRPLPSHLFFRNSYPKRLEFGSLKSPLAFTEGVGSPSSIKHINSWRTWGWTPCSVCPLVSSHLFFQTYLHIPCLLLHETPPSAHALPSESEVVVHTNTYSSPPANLARQHDWPCSCCLRTCDMCSSAALPFCFCMVAKSGQSCPAAAAPDASVRQLIMACELTTFSCDLRSSRLKASPRSLSGLRDPGRLLFTHCLAATPSSDSLGRLRSNTHASAGRALRFHMATAQCERCGTSASAHSDPALRIKSANSVPDPSIPDHQMQYLKSDVELSVRSIPVPYSSTPILLPHACNLILCACPAAIAPDTSLRQQIMACELATLSCYLRSSRLVPGASSAEQH